MNTFWFEIFCFWFHSCYLFIIDKTQSCALSLSLHCLSTYLYFLLLLICVTRVSYEAWAQWKGTSYILDNKHRNKLNIFTPFCQLKFFTRSYTVYLNLSKLNTDVNCIWDLPLQFARHIQTCLMAYTWTINLLYQPILLLISKIN